MLDFRENLAVQSYCLRHLKDQGIPAVCRKLLETGLPRIGIGNPADPTAFADIIRQYHDCGVTINDTFASFSADLDAIRRAFECAQLLGHTSLTADFRLMNGIDKAFRHADALAAEFGIRVAIHNHGATHWLGSQTMLDFVFANTSENIGLCLDTAWAYDSHINPVQACQRWPKRIVGVHFKDFTYSADGSHEDVVIGQGTIDLPALIQALRDIDFSGHANLEYEGEPENPIPALIAGRDAILKLA